MNVGTPRVDRTRDRPLRWAVWVCLLLAGEATAQTRDVRFRRLGLADGLPSSTVQQVLQDRQGFIWVATQDGLSRFDGYRFATYRSDPADPSSLPHDHVWAVEQDRLGVFWIGTDGGGLSRLAYHGAAFEHFRHDPDDATSLSGNRVRAILEDRRGVLWVGTDGGGLNRFDRRTETFTRYRHDPGDPTSLPSDRVRQLIEDGEGRIWIATDGGGVAVLDPSSGTFSHYRHDPARADSLSSDRVRAVYEAVDGTVWVGTYDAGLNRLDAAAGTFQRFQRRRGDPTSLAADKVSAILEDGLGTLWVGTDSGLEERLPEGGGFRHHRHDPTDPRSLSHDTVVSLFEDRGGVLWVGTFGGLSNWNTTYGSFAHFGVAEDGRAGLSNSYVNAFFEDRSGALWIGTFGGGLNRLDRARTGYRVYRHRPGDPGSLSDDRVMSLLVDRRGTLWVGTMDGLNRLDRARGAFRRFRHDPSDPSSLSANGITALLEDRRGRLWVGTYRGGLHRYDPASGGFVRLRHAPDDPTSLSSDRVMSLWEDADGALWVGTEDAGLNRLHPLTDTFSRFRHDPLDPTSLSGDDAWIVTGDEAGNLWVGTRSAGLNRWHPDDRREGRVRFERLSIAGEMESGAVYGVVVDGAGDVWASSLGALSRIDPESGQIARFDVSHGLQSEFNFGAAYRGRDGRIYFGGVYGFNAFYPRQVHLNRHVPPVVLTRFFKFNQPVDLGPSAATPGEVTLGFRDSVVAFEFAALDYTAPEKNRYQYKLEGFDRGWMEANALRSTTYTNLDAGSYVFRVRASNNDGLWNEQGLAIGVRVAPPPWLSWWARSLYTIVLGAVIILVLRTLAARRRRAEELERINAELEQEIRARKAKERALETEKLKTREYLDVAEVIMVAIDRDGKIVLINQKGCGILGYEEGEIVGSDWLERFVPADHRDEVATKLARIEEHRYCEYPIVTRGGEERVIAWHSTLLPSAEGDAPVVLSSGTDNTEVRKLEKQVRMQQKMDALGTLAGGIAHDFNNILTAILGYSTLTLSQLPAGSEEAGYMKHVVSGCERARDMVVRILTFSRREDPARRPVDLGPVVQEACDLLRSSLPPSVDIRTVIEPDLSPVDADPTQIHQVLMNLGTNAGHAMPDGGTLEVKLEMIEVAPGSHDLDGQLRRGSYAQITVTDDGHGMDKATLERIFDPFFTTKEVGSGTGLGLSVAHGIVKSHQGDISVKSSVDHGTRVVVRIPCSEAETRGERPKAAAVEGEERILLVDDEKPIVVLAKKWLEGLGYSVEPHTDSVEALAAFRAKPGRFDLVVTDQRMPEMDGVDLIAEVRRIRAELPAVLTSGRRYRRESAEHDAVWLQKPFTADDLGSAVRRALDAKKGHLRSVG